VTPETEIIMSSSILVTGGTGTLGRLVVPLLRAAGAPVRILSRAAQPSPASPDPADGVQHVTGDLATGAGVEAAVEGVETILHCAGSSKGDDVKARNLVRAVQRSGARHLVYISVVGAERVPVVSAIDRASFGYFAAKRAAEVLVEESGVPWTTLRASQFFELTLTVFRQMAKLPVVPVPAGVQLQPVDAGEVAARLVELTLGAPAGLVPDLAGPQVRGMDDLLRTYLRVTHKRRLIMPVRFAGRAYRAVREGANVAPDRAVGRRTWEEFLAQRIPAAQPSSGGRR
jgi:uncharacterized protein YbjT (DUF2867 family)